MTFPRPYHDYSLPLRQILWLIFVIVYAQRLHYIFLHFLVLKIPWHFENLKIFRGLEEGIFLNSMTFSGFPCPFQILVTLARLRYHHCHDQGMNKVDVLTTTKTTPAIPNFMWNQTGNRNTFPPPHINQSSSWNGDTAWGLIQIYSEVTFSADAPLSLRTIIRTHAQGSPIYRFTEKHVLPFVKSSAEWELLIWEFD